jgi:hypothetical protein
MADVTRRGFLTQMSITTGVGIAGGLGLHRLLATDAPAIAAQPLITPEPVQVALGGVSLAGPMVLHVRDLANAEISMMVGTQELIYRDPELVSRLVQTAAGASNQAEG